MPTTSGGSGRTRILIADDNKYIREKVVQLVAEDFDVIGTAADGKGACEAIQLLRPEIVVMDISMPGLSGIETMAKIKEEKIVPKIVFLTVHDDPDFVRAALEAGGSGYVVKSQMAADLLTALRSARDGKLFVSPCIAIHSDNFDSN